MKGMLVPITLGRFVARLVTGESTGEAITAVMKAVESRGFKHTNTVEDCLGLADDAWYDYKPTPPIAKHFPEITVHANHFSGVSLESRPLVFGHQGPMTIEQGVLFKEITDDIIKDINHKCG